MRWKKRTDHAKEGCEEIINKLVAVVGNGGSAAAHESRGGGTGAEGVGDKGRGGGVVVAAALKLSMGQ